jgi:hypothetical protein
MIDLLDPPSLSRGKQSQKFFSDEGKFREEFLMKGLILLEQRETSLEGQDKENFCAQCDEYCSGSQRSATFQIR